MSDLRTAAQQALKALHEIAWCNDSRWQTDRAESVIPALRAALAQQDEPKGGGNLPPPLQAEPVQEPVAWRHKGAGHFTVTPLVSKFPEWEPLYTRPPRREWKSLTEEEIDRWTPEIHPVIRAVEAKLKEKNNG
jgi:hypothetical protein